MGNSQFSTLNSQFQHVPVLLAEVLAGLVPQAGGYYIDGTLGGSGHAAAILKMSAPDGRLLGIDADPAAIETAGARLAAFGARAKLVHGNFRDLKRLAHEADFKKVDGILLDLGVSSHQLGTPERGFSVLADAPLDMRMDTTSGESARNENPRSGVPSWCDETPRSSNMPSTFLKSASCASRFRSRKLP